MKREQRMSPGPRRFEECVELHLHSLNATSWRGAQLAQEQLYILPLPVDCSFLFHLW
jgi:hypothetical protein